jgi:hypothetical protein
VNAAPALSSFLFNHEQAKIVIQSEHDKDKKKFFSPKITIQSLWQKLIKIQLPTP